MIAALAGLRLAEVLQTARRRNASDVHLRCGLPPLLRVDGRLEPVAMPPTLKQEVESIAQSVLGDALEQLEREGDVTVGRRDPEIGRLRIHAYRTGDGIALALRLLALEIPSLESTGMPGAVAALCSLSRGLLLVAGPTGSGKSTLLAAMVDWLNRRHSKHIITIEDPIEYEHRPVKSLINQREIGSACPAFAAAVQGALRCDPDVILIGEMRDPETMHAALTAAETGHLVFATLHTGDCAQTIDRVIGSFGGDMQEQVRTQLAQTLAGVVSTRLVPRSGGHGRVCAAEVLVANDAVRHMIRDGKTHQIASTISTGRQFGMQTLQSHLSELVTRGEITPEAAKAVTA